METALVSVATVWEWLVTEYGDWRDVLGLAGLTVLAMALLGMLIWAEGMSCSGGAGKGHSGVAMAADTEQCCQGRCERCQNMQVILKRLYEAQGVRG